MEGCICGWTYEWIVVQRDISMNGWLYEWIAIGWMAVQMAGKNGSSRERMDLVANKGLYE